MKLADLRESRASKISEMRALVAGAESAGRDLTADESARFDALRSDAENIEARLGRAEAIADMERRAAATPVSGEFARESRTRYSVARAIQGALSGKLSGLEGEAHAELSKGRESRGVMIPTEALLGIETRDGQTVTPDTAGGYLVQTAVATMQDRFRPLMRVESLGATVLRNLSGPIDLPNLAASGSTHWIAEGQDTTRSAATFERVNMTPRTVSAEYKVSRRLLLQSSESIEQILRADLGQLLAGEIDRAAIAGEGVDEPLGILNTPNVEAITTSQSVLAHAADLIAILEGGDVPMTSRGFLMNSVVAKLGRTLMDGEGIPFGWPVVFHGERTAISNNVPDDLSGSKSGLIYGEWSQLYVGYWSGIDLVPNIYHSDVASAGGMLLHAFADVDVAVRNPAAFAYSEI